jgi:hypothetical protein
VKAVTTILNKVLVREFYLANATFFLVVVGLAGGFMRSIDHIILAELLVSSPILLLIPIGVWTAYSFKVTRFNRAILKRGENEFLYYVSTLPVTSQVTALAKALLLQLLPIFLYAAFLIATAAKHGLYFTLFLIPLACVVLSCLAVADLFIVLLKGHREQKLSALARWIHARFTKPYPLFFPEWIVRRSPWMAIGTKLAAGLLLFAVAQVYKTDTYDARLLGMGVVFAFAANVNMIWEMHRFDNHHFDINRNLPIPFARRFLYFMITLAILTLPEAGLLISHFTTAVSWVELVGALLFGWSIALFLYGWLFRHTYGPDQLHSIVFFTCILLVVLILFKIPFLMLAFINIAGGLYLWRKYFYTFEIPMNEEKA